MIVFVAFSQDDEVNQNMRIKIGAVWVSNKWKLGIYSNLRSGRRLSQGQGF